jgi:phosphopantetheine adenylyltransferase
MDLFMVVVAMDHGEIQVARLQERVEQVEEVVGPVGSVEVVQLADQDGSQFVIHILYKPTTL